MAGNIAIEHHASIGRKIPVPPDKCVVDVTDDQAEMGALVVFNGNIDINSGDSFSLSAGECS
ncbi:hypothetical protein SAMN03159286_2603 [Enterobacter sp. NFIX58]|nr:hypothetical protein SAMN03159286_2603 [Enterobacter sp. NFIX58]